MGPLVGLKVVEMPCIGPGPLCAMLLADLGATVLRLDRTTPAKLGAPRPLKYNLPLRNRRAIALDLKRPGAAAFVMALVEKSDALVEGFRPGVMERLGLGPDACLERNPRLVYGRATGWGQSGPLSGAAAHDLNYIALTGALHAIGRRGQAPSVPLNLVGDYGGGALYLAFGIMCALFERQRSGKGQVVDAAIVDGVASMMVSAYGLQSGGFVRARGENALDSGSYFYDSYQCADGEWITLAAIEQKFHEELLRRLDLDPADVGPQWEPSNWPRAKDLVAARIRQKTRDEWRALLEGTDSCFAPVLSMMEAPSHPHFKERGTFIEIDGIVQPAPAPRFSRSTPARPTPPEAPDATRIEEALAGWMDPSEIARYRESLLG